MYSDNSFFSSTFTFVTSSSSTGASAALVHGSNTSTTSSSGGSGGGQLNSAYAAVGSNPPQPQIHYLQLPQRESRTMSSRSAAHGHHGGGHRTRSRPYNIVKPIQKRVERTRRDSAASMTPTHRSSRTGGGARTPNLFIDQLQERPSGSTPLSSSGQIHTPLANFEASFDGIAALGFDLDAFGSNERLMATSPTLSASS